MKQLSSVLVFLILALAGNAQQNHFIYLQTENKQPFYVKQDNKVFSSSGSGYAILPKFTDGDYTLVIGFPKNVFPEMKFPCTVAGKDLGYVLKDLGEKGWALYNIESSDLIMPGEVAVKNTTPRQTSDDPFSNMLANVVHDTTINKKEDVVVPVADSVRTAQVAGSAGVTVKEGPSKIKRMLRKKGKDGIQLIYVDHNDSKNDTIRILIPVEKIAVKAVDSVGMVVTSVPAGGDSIKKEPVKEVVKDTMKEVAKDAPDKAVQPEVKAPPVEEKKEEKVPVEADIKTLPAKTDTTATVVSPPAVGVKKEVSMINSDCKAEATDDDFMKLRRKMVAENNDDDMIRVGKKIFRSKCFTTEQVKNLSTLFLKDDGKYSFFEAAYPFITDSGNFSNLENQLSDPYYINRFRAMVHK